MMIFDTMRKRVALLGLLLLSALPQTIFAQKKLENPLDGSISDIPDLLIAILNVILIIAMPIIVLYIIYAGFKYAVARGNPEQLQEATRSLTFAVIGGVIIVGSFAILAIVSNLVAAF